MKKKQKSPLNLFGLICLNYEENSSQNLHHQSYNYESAYENSKNCYSTTHEYIPKFFLI